MTDAQFRKRDNEIVLKEGKFLRLLRKGNWEYVQRHNCSGIVIVVAATQEGKVIFTEQQRIPVGARVIEFPAGLVNDIPGAERETPQTAARRELLEETGYRARRMIKLAQGPAAGGSSSDILIVYLAQGLEKVEPGGGDETESIVVHEIPVREVESWLDRKRRQGVLVDPKIYAGLYFLAKYNV